MNLADKLLQLRPGATFVTFIGNTPLHNQRKRDNPYYPIRVVAEYNGLLHFDYGKNVQNALTKKGIDEEFTADDVWHEQVLQDGHLTALRRHKKTGELYLWFRQMSVKNARYFAGDGREVTWDDIQPYVREKKGSKKQEEAGLEESEQVYPRTFKLENILTISHRDMPS